MCDLTPLVARCAGCWTPLAKMAMEDLGFERGRVVNATCPQCGSHWPEYLEVAFGVPVHEWQGNGAKLVDDVPSMEIGS